MRISRLFLIVGRDSSVNGETCSSLTVKTLSGTESDSVPSTQIPELPSFQPKSGEMHNRTIQADSYRPGDGTLLHV
jgi:hypothetical protein